MDQFAALDEEIGKTRFSLDTPPTPTHQVHEMDTPRTHNEEGQIADKRRLISGR